MATGAVPYSGLHWDINFHTRGDWSRSQRQVVRVDGIFVIKWALTTTLPRKLLSVAVLTVSLHKFLPNHFHKLPVAGCVCEAHRWVKKEKLQECVEINDHHYRTKNSKKLVFKRVSHEVSTYPENMSVKIENVE